MPFFDKLKTEEFAKGRNPTIAKIGVSHFLEVHVSDSFLSSDNLEYQLMEMAEDGSITLKTANDIGIKG